MPNKRKELPFGVFRVPFTKKNGKIQLVWCVKITCKTCGKEANAAFANIKAGHGRFCSKACASKSRTGSKNAYWKGGISKNKSRYLKIQKQRYPEKVLARGILRDAVKHGKIIRGPCEVCGKDKDVHGHHEDYSQPLNVKWLCREHHFKLHGFWK